MAAFGAVLCPMPALARAPEAATKCGVLSWSATFYWVVTYCRRGGSLTDANSNEGMTLPEAVFDHVAWVARIRSGSDSFGITSPRWRVDPDAERSVS